MGKTLPQSLIDSVNELPIEDVISDIAGVVFDSRGFGESPFRNGTDELSQSFSVKRSTNVFTDWKLRDSGYSGGPIKFYQLYKGVPFVQAVLELAVGYGILSETELKQYTFKKIKTVFRTAAPKVERQPIKVSEKKEIAALDAVYRTIISMSPLSDEHRDYLLGRGLTMEEIEEHMFFTPPTRVIARKLEKLGIDLEGIPGFFKHQEDSSNWAYMAISGIGFPVISKEGLIQGIQVRTMTEGHKNRYFWVSSASADGVTQNKSGVVTGYWGCGPGTPIDYIPGESSTLFITEGKFKAIAVRRYFPWATASVQGVGNWQEIGHVIGDYDQFIIGYDADMIGNELVLNQIIKLSDFLRTGNGKVQIAVWNPNYGKGIDDLLLAGHQKEIELLDYEEFIQKFKDARIAAAKNETSLQQEFFR